jgi:hypothetical protein
MILHRLPGCLRVAADDSIQNFFVMDLPALQATLGKPDALSLFTEKINYGVHQNWDDGILCPFSQRQVKIQVSLHK